MQDLLLESGAMNPVKQWPVSGRGYCSPWWLSLGELNYHGHLSPLREHLRGRAVRFLCQTQSLQRVSAKLLECTRMQCLPLLSLLGRKDKKFSNPQVMLHLLWCFNLVHFSEQDFENRVCIHMCVYICIHWPFSFYINNILLKNWKSEWINVWNTQLESEISCGWQGFCKAFCSISIWSHSSERKHFCVCAISTQKRDFESAAVRPKVSACVSTLFR